MNLIRTIQWRDITHGLSEQDHNFIESKFINISRNSGAPIFQMGDISDSLFIVNSGRVRLTYHSTDGIDFIVGIWSRGYVFGLISTLLNESRFISAEAASDVNLSVFKKKDFLSALINIPIFSINISRAVSIIAKGSIQRSYSLAIFSAEYRLGRVLLQLAQLKNESPDKFVIRGVTQGELAAMAGITRVWANRILQNMASRGLLTIDPDGITLLDIDQCLLIWCDNI